MNWLRKKIVRWLAKAQMVRAGKIEWWDGVDRPVTITGPKRTTLLEIREDGVVLCICGKSGYKITKDGSIQLWTDNLQIANSE